MRLKRIEDIRKALKEIGESLTEEEKQLIVWFGCHTDDLDLTRKFIAEMAKEGCDRERVAERFLAMTDWLPEWILQLEKILTALELLRIREEEELKLLSRLLRSGGMAVPEYQIERAGKTERTISR